MITPDSERLGELLESNDIAHDGEALSRRLNEDGYLFFRELQDPDELRLLRRQMLTVMQQGGWIEPDTDPVDGIARDGAQCTEGDSEYTDVYHEVYRLQLFHEIAHRPRIMEAVGRISGHPMMPQPQKVARLWFPNYTEHTTPVHQDFVHFQGSFDNLTCWAPVGDCPRELGGLAVLRGSHCVERVLDHHFSLGAGSLVVHPQEYPELGNCEWLTTDYQIGDTLIFPALTIHQALPNVTADRLRVSLDNRYQVVGHPIAEHMTTPHLSNFSSFDWENVYDDWNSDELKYYWKEIDNPIVPRDMSYSDKGFAEAVELAQGGNEFARHHLQRFISRAPDSPEGLRAAEVLSE